MIHDTLPAVLDGAGHHDAWAEFRVDDPGELLRLLQRLRDASAPVMLSSPQGALLSSQLWTVDAPQRQISLCADADAHGVQLQRLLQDDEAVAVAYLDQVKLQFDLTELVLVRALASNALRAQLPSMVFRFQRRASYRVRSIASSVPKALLRHPSLPDMRIALRIVDLSAGGCALRLPDDVPALQPGSLIAGTRIELDGGTSFDATLCLQHVGSMPQGSGGGQRLGCSFVDLDAPAQRALQRFIDHTQQRRRLLSRR